MSASPVVCAKVDRVITQWLLGGRMFTAFEVSLEIKSQGIRNRHRQMKAAIHNSLMSQIPQFQYTRTLMDVGAPDQAFVYHRAVDDPVTYVPLDRSTL